MLLIVIVITLHFQNCHQMSFPWATTGRLDANLLDEFPSSSKNPCLEQVVESRPKSKNPFLERVVEFQSKSKNLTSPSVDDFDRDIYRKLPTVRPFFFNNLFETF